MKWLILAAVLAGIILAGQPVKIAPLAFDSAARAVGEVARALGGKGRGMLEPYSGIAAPFLRLLRELSEPKRLSVIHFGMAHTVGLPGKAFDSFDLEALFSTYIARYPNREYQAVVIGSPGGGVAHLASLLDAPFLPNCALVGTRHHIEPDDFSAYLASGRTLGEALAPDGRFEVIIHYDPIHDRDLVNYAALVRVRLLSLPECYKNFIQEHLMPGGAIVLVEGTYPWPQIELEEEVWLQVGGLGVISPEEYLSRYPPPGEPVLRRESEWGCPEAFAEDVRFFAKEEEYQLISAPAPHPIDYSKLAFQAYLAAGARRDSVLLDCFTTMDARFCKWTGIPPLHLPFLTRDALNFASDFLSQNPVERKFLLLHPSYASPPDLASLAEWREVLPDGEILVDERFWPADPYAPFAAAEALSRLEEEYKLPAPLSLSVDELASLFSG